MYITPHTISVLDTMFKMYPSKISEDTQDIYDYILPSRRRERRHFFNDLKSYKNKVSEIKSCTYSFLEHDLQDFGVFDDLYQMYGWDYTSVYITIDYQAKSHALPNAFTFCYNFLTLFRFLHKDVRLVAGITSNVQKKPQLLLNGKLETYEKYNFIYIIHYQMLFENFVFSHTELEIPKGYTLQFDTEDLPLIKWMIKNAQLRQKMINLRDKAKMMNNMVK